MLLAVGRDTSKSRGRNGTKVPYSAVSWLPLVKELSAGRVYRDQLNLHGFVYDCRTDLAALDPASQNTLRVVDVQTVDYRGAVSTMISDTNFKGQIVGLADTTGPFVTFIGTPAPELCNRGLGARRTTALGEPRLFRVNAIGAGTPPYCALEEIRTDATS